MEEECNDDQSPPLTKNSITIVGIGHVEILDLDDGLLQFAKLDNTHVCSHKKHKNITTMHRIVNIHPNTKIKLAVSKIDCPKNTGFQFQKILSGLIRF